MKTMGNNYDYEQSLRATEAFWNCPAEDLPLLLQGKEVVVPGKGSFWVSEIQTFPRLEGRFWQPLSKFGRRITDMLPGEVELFKARGNIPVVKAEGVSHLVLRGLENITTGELIPNASRVSEVLGLQNNEDRGVFQVVEDRIEFRRVA